MRLPWRTSSSALVRDIALVCLADGIVGVSFGATSAAGHLPWWVPVGLSVFVFAGAAQIGAVGVVLAGGSPLAAVAAGAVLNTRLLPYGLAVANVVRPAGTPGPRDADAGNPGGGWLAQLSCWVRMLARTHLILDESVAFALRQTEPARRRAAFLTCGAGMFVVWNTAVLLGVLVGSVIGSTSAFGLDATFPAVMLALALPALSSRPTRVAAGTGAVIAVALTPVLPVGLPLLAALAGLGTRWRGPGGWRGREKRELPGQAAPADSNAGGQA